MAEIRRIKDIDCCFKYDTTCIVCGKPIKLNYNNGDLDEKICCGLRYSLEHATVDFVIEKIIDNKICSEVILKGNRFGAPCEVKHKDLKDAMEMAFWMAEDNTACPTEIIEGDRVYSREDMRKYWEEHHLDEY